MPDLSRQDKIEYIAALDERLRREARQDFLTFVRYVYPSCPHAREDTYKVNWHHRRLADLLNQFAEGEITRLIVSMPPRHGKSELCSRMLPAYLLGRDPSSQIIGTGHSSQFAKRELSKPTKKIIQSKRYQRVFPETRIPSKNVSTDSRYSFTNTAGEWDIQGHSGGYYSAGSGKGIEGVGADYLLIDDPQSQQDAYSEKERQNIWDWYQTSASARLQSGGQVLIVATRWALDDLPGRLIRAGESSKHADDWHVVNYKALSTPESVSDGTDPREQTDKPLWPEMYDYGFLAGKRESMGDSFEAVYQQNPVPAGGSIVQREWIEGAQYSPVKSPNLDDCTLIQSWDLRHGGKGSGSSFAVGQLWARPTKGSDVYLIDQKRGRWDLPETLDVIKAAQDEPQWGRSSGLLVEDKADGKAVIPLLRREIPGLIPVSPSSSKEARLNACTPYFRAGNVRIPTDKPWVAEYIHELTAFPGASHDDQVDATSQALKYLFEEMRTKSSRKPKIHY